MSDVTSPTPVTLGGTKLQVLGAEDTQKISEKNTYWNFFWMLNAKGARVPVPTLYLQEMLRRGYIHTDGKVYTENPADDVRLKEPQNAVVDPTVAMANAVEKLAQTQEATVEILEEVTQVKKRGKKVKNSLAEEEVTSA